MGVWSAANMVRAETNDCFHHGRDISQYYYIRS